MMFYLSDFLLFFLLKLLFYILKEIAFQKFVFYILWLNKNKSAKKIHHIH